MSHAAKDSQVSVRLPAELTEQIAGYSTLTGRSKSHVVMEAVREYLHWRVPQTADLKEAIAAADRGEFAEEAEVEAAFAAYSSPKDANRVRRSGSTRSTRKTSA